jgi:ribosome-associated protein YbcJ (S4-like RNA binding protein)
VRIEIGIHDEIVVVVVVIEGKDKNRRGRRLQADGKIEILEG